MKISLGFGIGDLRKLSKKGSFPEWFRKSIVCYYDPKRQGLTNEDISKQAEKGQPFIAFGFALILHLN